MIKLITTPKRMKFLYEVMTQTDWKASDDELQKILFVNSLYGESKCYDFIPGKLGPHSFQLSRDLDIMRNKGINGLIFSSKKQTFNKAFFSEIIMNLSKYLKKAYDEFPFYAPKDGWAYHNLFYKEERSISKDYTIEEPITGKLFTIGYEGNSIESFINRLLNNNITLLIDVRKNPISRKFGFSKNRLQESLNTVGVRYLHLAQFGIDSVYRRSLKTPDDYRLLFSHYDEYLSSHQDLVDSLIPIIQKNRRVSLMCFEHDSKLCHRHILKKHLIKTISIPTEDL